VNSLHDFFDRYVRGGTVSLVYDNGLRTWSYSSDQLRAAAIRFSARLAEAGLRQGDRLAIWSENRPEWVAAFWGCMLQGVVVIPVDVRASAALARRFIGVGAPRVVLVGDDVPSDDWPSATVVWRVRDHDWWTPEASPPARTAPRRAPVSQGTLAEIVFTSGATGDPKGVLITHGNILANISAIAPEAARFGPYLWPLRPLRLLELLPLSHMFGQALTMFLPPLVRAGAVFVKGYNPDNIVSQIGRHRITLVVTVPRVLEMLRDRLRARVPHCANPPSVERSLPARLWRYRAIRPSSMVSSSTTTSRASMCCATCHSC
jgi:long-chain acyl-CoA synthetase